MTPEESKTEGASTGKSKLEAYYDNVQTLFWFDKVLGGARHFGYYEPGTKSPLPIRASLRRMEAQLYNALQLPIDAKVLDAGCGAGHVSEFMAQKGLHVVAIDVVPRHVTLTEKTKARLSKDRSVPGTIEVQQMDYHHLEALGEGSFDGVYTIEALVHAADPLTVLAGFLRQLKPGGRIVLHEYEQDIQEEDRKAMAIVNEGFSMPMHEISRPGAMAEMVERVGFCDVETKDLSQNVRPMTRMNYAISIVPYTLLKPLGLAKHSLNAVAGVQLHRNLKKGQWKYVQIRAAKPELRSSTV
ncbi:S-adenosyl-L-methionine-dependent methyltransferase [Decorospora gaudefroyi]|uniref:S-adenosyl-L-methionine-dependent methyltransferase n=1 Tax=Decorospora gaudefroyi TaxID=184978 RepID=A0A6A5KHV8_9PLEO|nr:S-adenosyl-L-methionine-dependent methyltransferase [Decorospora gaudefroyi]